MDSFCKAWESRHKLAVRDSLGENKDVLFIVTKLDPLLNCADAWIIVTLTFDSNKVDGLVELFDSYDEI